MRTIATFSLLASFFLISSCDYFANRQENGLFAQSNKPAPLKQVSVIDPSVGVEAVTLLLPKGLDVQF